MESEFVLRSLCRQSSVKWDKGTVAQVVWNEFLVLISLGLQNPLSKCMQPLNCQTEGSHESNQRPVTPYSDLFRLQKVIG